MIKLTIFIAITSLLIFITANSIHAQYDAYDNMNSQDYLGQYNSNYFNTDSISNPSSPYSSELSPNNLNNLMAQYDSPTSPNNVTNPLSLDTSKLYSQDIRYLEKITNNLLDSGLANNLYSNTYSPESVNNPNGQYASPYGPNSANNPYATSAPLIYPAGDNE